MRKETREIASAWWHESKPLHKARTQTDGYSVYLHGNKIAWRELYDNGGGCKAYHFTLAGWPTITTRERLNGLLKAMGADKARFYQRKGKQYFRDLKGIEREIQDTEIVTIKV